MQNILLLQGHSCKMPEFQLSFRTQQVFRAAFNYFFLIWTLTIWIKLKRSKCASTVRSIPFSGQNTYIKKVLFLKCHYNIVVSSKIFCCEKIKNPHCFSNLIIGVRQRNTLPWKLYFLWCPISLVNRALQTDCVSYRAL